MSLMIHGKVQFLGLLFKGAIGSSMNIFSAELDMTKGPHCAYQSPEDGQIIITAPAYSPPLRIKGASKTSS
ncbi:hypothetical protein [Bartonella sp. CL29QHWL]|uniref:hypothetical protein n=1 Tax=Bartonella sp. CL29QHWL TaxID=3243522 RepID=UPI0035D0BA6E